jgi:hypothetical protein
MKPEIFQYKFGASFLAVIKNECVVDIACSSKYVEMYTGESRISKKVWVEYIKVRTQDLALYTHWPIHTKEFWELLNEI